LQGFFPSYEEAAMRRTRKVHEEEMTKYDGEKIANFYDF